VRLVEKWRKAVRQPVDELRGTRCAPLLRSAAPSRSIVSLGATRCHPPPWCGPEHRPSTTNLNLLWRNNKLFLLPAPRVPCSRQSPRLAPPSWGSWRLGGSPQGPPWVSRSTQRSIALPACCA
jgi:hypothetical protein